MAYAVGTSVSIEKSINEIVGMIKKAGAVRIAQAEEPDGLKVQFFLNERMLRFSIKFVKAEDFPERTRSGQMVNQAQKAAQRNKEKVRAMLLVIKAKLESIESEIETFDEAFLANIVMSDRHTVYERVSESIALEYKSGKPMPLLLSPPATGEPS